MQSLSNISPSLRWDTLKTFPFKKAELYTIKFAEISQFTQLNQ